MLPIRLGALPALLLLAAPILLDTSSDGCPSDDDDDTITPTPTPTEGTTYYVAPWGDDANTGTLEAPWQTLGMAASSARAGDTVYLREGTWHEPLVPEHSGTAAYPIVFSAMPGEQITLDGTDVSTPWSTSGGMVQLASVDYVHVIGLEVVHSPVAAIYAEYATGIRIEGNATYDSYQSGIGVWHCVDVLILDNEVELACNDGDQESITVADTDGFDVVGNHVHDGGPGTRGGEGIDAKDGSRNGRIWQNLVHDMNRLGIYVDAWDAPTYNIEVYQNTVHHCDGSGFAVAAESGGLLENVRIYNNLAWLNEYNGMTVASWGRPTSHPMQGIEVVNNTFVQNGTRWGGGIEIDNPEAGGILIRNNILSQNQNYQLLASQYGEDLVMDFNLIDGFRGEEQNEVTGDAHVEGTPDFVDPDAFDLHLTPSSPAVDAGQLEGAPAADLDDVARPQGTGVDIGAYELEQAQQRRSSRRVNGPGPS